MEKLAQKYGQHYIDVNAGLMDETDEQKRKYSIGGVHMYVEAYTIVFENLRQYLVN